MIIENAEGHISDFTEYVMRAPDGQPVKLTIFRGFDTPPNPVLTITHGATWQQIMTCLPALFEHIERLRNAEQEGGG